ncbi:lytic transglycosylase catalytic subunit [Caballeronia temeraria]|uniref:Lytic transglycosylase catalytic subunit n=1 Tax=Caballeronia temeraria TaxID=1777137 RepID=A0A157Z3M1_9BURK|nr:lytic transglycosylase domain-containing protein [Caballeronia temeraria]SAK39909.1 lytic transglycosylase catalytic subunit [Caballeronia temeraria]
MRSGASGIEGRHVIAMLMVIGVLAACDRAQAASMLRCESEDSTVVYVSTRIEHAKCVRVNMSWQGSTPAAPASGTSVTPVAPLVRRQATAHIWTYVEDGVRHFLTRKPVDVSASVSIIELHFIETCNLCAPGDEVNVAGLSLDTRSYGREIDAAAASFGVDSALVRAVIHAESAYRANVISRAGAQGLMQLMPATASRFNVGDPFDAAQNIRGGVQYLAWLLKRFSGNLDLALAAYNSGEAAVDRYDGVPPYNETRTYVSRVKTLAERYRGGR